MLKKSTKLLLSLIMMIQIVGQLPITALAIESWENPGALVQDFSESGHSVDELDQWDPAGNEASDVTPYNYGDEAPEDDWYGVDEDQMVDEEFRPYYLEPVARMSNAEIAAFAGIQIGFDADGNEVPVHQITTVAQLQQFLHGTLGENHHHFVIPPNTPLQLNAMNAATFLTRGRPGIFTGVFEGNGNTISGLRLRNGRLGGNPPAAATLPNDGAVGIGLVQMAGHGAVIRNLNIFAGNATHSGTPTIASGAIVGQTGMSAAEATQSLATTNHDFIYITTHLPFNIGGFVGATVQNEPGVESVVTLQNVNLLGSGTQSNRATFQRRAGGIAMAQRTAGGSWGGLVGRVQTGSTLNMVDVTVEDFQVRVAHSARPNHEVRAISMAGGMVGSVHGGNLNITTNNRETNFVNTDMRSNSRGGGGATVPSHPTSNTDGRYTGINTAGGVVGMIHSGHVHIEDMEIMSLRHPHDPLRARLQVGGAVGNMNVQASLRLYNVQNSAQLQVNSAGGENSMNGRAGGLIGRTLGAVHIENSRNYGIVQGQGNHQVLGGLIGYTGPSSSVVIIGSRNGQLGGGVGPNQRTGCTSDQACNLAAHSGGGAAFPMPTGVSQGPAGLIRHINNAPPAGNLAGNPNQTAATMGGIVGRSRGRLIIEDTVNHGHIHKHRLNTSAASRRNTRLGGIVGRINPVGGQVITLDNVRNHGLVQLGQTQNETIIGGIVAEIMAPARGQANITITDAVNHATITGGAHSGGIVGWTRARGIVIEDPINHGLITRNTANPHPQDAGGIVGRSGAADLRIINPINNANITPTGARGAYHAGGIIGRASGASLYIENAYNTGNVRGHANGAGVVGFADGNDARIQRAVNRGNNTATRPAGHTTAAGIVGRANRRNMQIREAANFGNIHLTGGNNVQDGVAGIMGRNDGANGVVESSFNVGNIFGRNTSGGIVGRNSGNLNITNVYNIGYVSNFGRTNAGAIGTTGGQNVRSGSGILGRRTSGNVRITNAFVSARVGGFAVGVHTGGNGVLQANGAVTGITFNNVFVDQNAFYSEGTGFQVNNPASQVNRPGVFLVDTEMLTSGFLPGISGGPWSIGINGVHPDLQRTYPFLTWQAPNGQDQFFDGIRSTNTVADVTAPRPVMDMQVQEITNRPVTFDFGGRPTAGVRHFNNYVHNNRVSSGNVLVTGNTLALTRPLTRPDGIVMAPVDNLNRSSIGLISPLGIVGFETREVSGRLVVRGFDPEFSTDADRYYISHARFEVVSDDSVIRDEIRLNEEFREVPGAPDEMRGMGVIAYVVDENQPLVVDRGLNPRPGGYTGDVASDLADATNPSTLANYTVVRITALGYEPTYRIIRQDDLVALSTGTISVPMERVPFEIRTWIPQTPEFPTADSELEVGPPGTATPGLPPHGAREGFGALQDHAPGSHLALDPVLNITTTPHNETRGGQNASLNAPEMDGIQGTIGHFAVTTVLWGDELAATGRHHTTNTISELRYTDLFDRGVSTWVTSDEERVRVLDIDMYVANTGLETIYVRFIHLAPTYQELYDIVGDMPLVRESNPQFRILNIDGENHTMQNPQPRIQLNFPNDPDAVITPMNAANGVHNPIYAWSNSGTDFGNQLQGFNNMTSAARPALNTFTTNFNTITPHFRVEGLTRDSVIDAIDLDDRFIALEGAELDDFLNYFYGLTNYEARQEAGHGELLTFSGTTNALRQTQINNAIDGGGAAAVEHSGSRTSGFLNRTVIIALRPIRHVPVRVVMQMPDGTFVDVEDATLTNNGEALTREEDGTFIIRDSGAANQLVADGGGNFYEHDGFNAHSEEIDGLLCESSEMQLLPDNNAAAVEVWVCLEQNDYIRIVLQPRPEPEMVTVTFDLNGGNVGEAGDADRFDPQTFIRNGQVTRPTPDPVREGYEFQHWVERIFLGCLDEEADDEDYGFVSFDHDGCENPSFDYHLWDFDNPVTQNKYLMAVWIPMHQVRFVPGPNGTLSTSSHISLIRDGEIIGAEGFVSGQIPNAGHVFSHWTSDTHDGTFTTDEIRNLPIYADTIFTAHFRILQFRVTFNLGDGRPADNAPAGQFDDQLVDWNTVATNPTAEPNPLPVHPEGYEFGMWALRVQDGYDEVTGDPVYTYIPWDFNTPIISDIELFAVGSNLNRVTFVASDGGMLSSDDVMLFRRDGETIGTAEYVPNPVWESPIIFMYWTSDSHVIRTCPMPDGAGDEFDADECDDSVAIIEPRRFYSEGEIREAIITEDTVFTAHFEELLLHIEFVVELINTGTDEAPVFHSNGILEGRTSDWVVPVNSTNYDAGVIVPTPVGNPGYIFSHWTSDCSMHSGLIFYTEEEILREIMYHNTVFTAHFVSNMHRFYHEVVGVHPDGGTLAAFYDDFEGDLITDNPTYIEAGDQVVLRATPAEGYRIYQWLINDLPVMNDQEAISMQQWIRNIVNPENVITGRYTGSELIVSDITSSTRVYVEFRPMPVVSYEITGGGQVAGHVADENLTIAQTGTPVPYRSDVFFSVTPDVGYRLASWTINGRSQIIPPVYTFLPARGITGDVVVRFVFVPITVEVDFETEGTGEVVGEVVDEDISIDEDGTVINYGRDVMFTATPAAGYRIAGWTVNGVERTGIPVGYTTSETLLVENVTVDTTVRVIFEPITFTVEFSATPEEGGTIVAVVGEEDIDSGDEVGYRATVTFTATPAAGYSIAGWTINGAEVDNQEATFTPPVVTEDIVVTVIFARDGHSAVIDANHVRVGLPSADVDVYAWLISEAGVIATSTLTQAGREPVTTNHANADDLNITITDFVNVATDINFVTGGQYIVTFTLPAEVTGTTEDETVTVIVTVVGARGR